jgi:hypothetical protein
MALVPAQPASAATIGAQFFGTHDSQPTGTEAGWPVAPIGSIRLWDSGVSWRDIEKADGEFDFQLLDEIVTMAKAKGSEILLVLGQTPTFHSSRPTETSFYGPGAAAPPDLTAWARYVGAVAQQYKGQGIRYQVWNEANIKGYFSGTPAQMGQLTRVADNVLREVDPTALLVGPAFATRLVGDSGRGWIDKFFAVRPSPAPAIDVVSLQLYPLSNGTPESAMTLLSETRKILRKYGVYKPIWNTEINYGVSGASNVTPLSNARQAAYVARTYVLNAGAGIKRVYWYGWDVQGIANTRMTYEDKHTVTPAGRAYSRVRSWMVDTRMDGCTRNSAGTYACTITYAYGKKRIYWNPSRVVYVRTASTATWKEGLDGVRTTIGGGKSLRVSYSPIVVRSRR